MAMEDFRVDVVIGKGPGATAIPLEIPPFTLVGATTRAGLLPGPLRDRFGFTAHLEFYEPADLELIVRRSAGLLDVELTDDGAAEIASRSRGTPRIANRLLRRVRDFAQVRADGVVTLDVARAGARRSTRSTSPASTGSTGRCSTSLCRRFGGGPVGVSHAGRRRRRGARDRRGGRRAVPGAHRPPRPHPARPGRHAGGLGSTSGCTAPPAPPRAPTTTRCSRTDSGAQGLTSRRSSHGYTSPSVGPPVVAGPAPPTRQSRGVSSWRSSSRLLPLLAIALVFWLLIIRPQRKRQKERGRDAVRPLERRATR